jgi:hypothetical protein
MIMPANFIQNLAHVYPKVPGVPNRKIAALGCMASRFVMMPRLGTKKEKDEEL